MTEQPGWYDAQMQDDAFLGESAAESKWHGRRRSLAPQPRYDVSLLIDKLIDEKLRRDGELPEPAERVSGDVREAA